MQTIEKIIKSTLPPRQTNVLWLDISGEKPILKGSNNGQWLPVSSEDADVKELQEEVGELDRTKLDSDDANIETIGGTNFNNHDYVDLGLPSGLLWATCNVGATNPEDYGDYFAWGEVETKSNYTEQNYRFYESEVSLGYTKYNSSDNLETLELEDDAAHINWGGDWRMPTSDEFQELIDNCTFEWTIGTTESGYTVTGPNGNTIFFPLTQGRRPRFFGEYWSSSLELTVLFRKNSFYFNFEEDDWYTINVLDKERYDKCKVRPVIESVPVTGTKITIKDKEVAVNTPPMINITWGELKRLRDLSSLTPGYSYRIIDYQTATGQENTKAAGRRFDVIVFATDVNTLSEDAKVTLHEGDTYFSDAGAKLESWQIKYCLYNDTDRFAWARIACFSPETHQRMIIVSDGSTNYLYVRYPNADNEAGKAWAYESTYTDFASYVSGGIEDLDTYDIIYSQGEDIFIGDELEMNGDTTVIVEDVSWEEGTGVIYYMKDEWNNECPYDFKNIQFNRALTDGEYDPEDGHATWVYTFTWVNEDNVVEDLSIVGNTLQNDDGQCPGIYDNVIKSISTNNKTAPGPQTEFGIALNDIVFISSYSWDGGIFYGCYSNIFGNNCHSNTFGNACCFNIFGNYCDSNTFKNDCCSNTFGDACCSNIFGNECQYNIFGKRCNYNTFGNGCYSNVLGNECNNNVFGGDCYSNTLGNNCGSNTFGNDFGINTFGNECDSNIFGEDCTNNIFRSNCYQNTFGNQCCYNIFGDECHNNTFGNEFNSNIFCAGCNNNTFGEDCYSNTFGTVCNYNIFGVSCYNNTFGRECSNNIFGYDCNNNTFGECVQYFITGNVIDATTSAQTANYIRYLIVENGVQFVNAYCTGMTSHSNFCQNIKIGLGLAGTSYSNRLQIDITSQIGATASVTYQPANSQVINI